MPGQQGGKGKNGPHDPGSKRLQRGTKQSQERFRRDSSVISCAKSFEDFRPECGKPGTKPEHMGMVGWGLFAPITGVGYIGDKFETASD